MQAGASPGSKVPPVTLMFWVIKICATTLGETGGDAVSMTLLVGYAVSSLIFLAIFAGALTAQLTVNRYHPFIYWLVVVATTTVGTTLSDYLDRTLGFGYVNSTVLLSCGVIAVLFAWRRVTGAIRCEDISRRDDEFFYWLTILVANTLGTALGDFAATDAGLGFEGGALLFAGLLAAVAAARFITRLPVSLLFWAAYVLTRPLGATLGDMLTKSRAESGLNLGPMNSSLVIAAAMVAMILVTYRKPAARRA